MEFVNGLFKICHNFGFTLIWYVNSPVYYFVVKSWEHVNSMTMNSNKSFNSNIFLETNWEVLALVFKFSIRQQQNSIIILNFELLIKELTTKRI